MDTLFLLRSYGDFVIGLSAFSNNRSTRNIQLVASVHLKPLYNELCEANVINPISFLRFENFGIRHHIMGCFTNRHFLKAASVNELLQLRKFCKHNIHPASAVFFEQKTRIVLPKLFTGKSKAGYVHNGSENIYDAYAAFAGTRAYFEEPVAQPRTAQVLITPGSRKANKALPVQLVAGLVKYYAEKKYKVQVAGLSSEIKKYNVPTVGYTNFRQLIGLVQQADWIISADSLPTHLAALVKKPHSILYNGKINEPWLTPFAFAKKTYATFVDWEKIKSFI